MVPFFSKKEVSENQKQNYKKGKQNSLRFLGDKRFLIPSMGILYFVLLLFGNWLISQIVALTQSGIFTPQSVSMGSAIGQLLSLDYPKAYLCLVLVDLFIVLYLSYVLVTSYRPLEENLVQGTMRFEKVKELDKQYPTVPVHAFTETEDFYDGVPGYPVARKPQTAEEKKNHIFRYYVDTTDSNSITLAGTRQGKGIYFVDPFIDILTRAKRQIDRASFILTATKGDEPRKWYKTLRRRGYNIRIVNTVNQFFSDPAPALAVFNNYYKHYKAFKKRAVETEDKNERIKVNVLAERQLANAEKSITQAAHMYFKEVNEGKDGGFWTKACRNLFVSTGIALADQEYERNEQMKVNPYTIYSVVNDMMQKRIRENSHDFLSQYVKKDGDLEKLLAEYEDKSTLDVFFGELPRSHPAKRHFDAIRASAPAHVTLGNIVTHFDGDLQSFLMSANAKMTAYDDGFDMESIGFDKDAPTAVFVVLSDADSSNNALGVMYIDQIYQVLLNRCNIEDDSMCYRPVHFIYEEGGNLGVPIHDLQRKWTSGLSRRLFSHLVLQDVEQVSDLYNEQVKKIILGNAGNLAYIRTGSDDTNKYVAGRLGKRTNYSKTRHKSPTSIKSTETESSERIDLLADFELERLRSGESIILRINKHEDLQGNPIYQYPIMNSLENDTNMIPFYKYRKLEKVSWEDIPVNNEFIELELDSLEWSLGEGTDSQERTNEDGERTLSVKEMKEKIRNALPPIEQFTHKNQVEKGKEIPIFTVDELKRLEKETDLEELQWKKQKVYAFAELYDTSELSEKVLDYFENKEIKELRKMILSYLIDDLFVSNELNHIIENNELRSLVVYIISNGDKRMIHRCINQFKEWKEEKE